MPEPALIAEEGTRGGSHIKTEQGAGQLGPNALT